MIKMLEIIKSTSSYSWNSIKIHKLKNRKNLLAQKKNIVLGKLANQCITPFTVICKNREAGLFLLFKNDFLIIYGFFRWKRTFRKALSFSVLIILKHFLNWAYWLVKKLWKNGIFYMFSAGYQHILHEKIANRVPSINI